MDIQEAREIVYGFSAIRLAATVGHIKDASTLPWPKTKIHEAFSYFIEMMEVAEANDPALFSREGYDETLDQARAVRQTIDEYHDIEPKDKDAVRHFNRRPAGKMWTDEEMPLLMRYPPTGGPSTA